MLMALEAELADATDLALATKILPSMMGALAGKLTNEDRTIAESLEFIFGDDVIGECKRLIESAAADAAKRKDAKEKANASAEEPVADTAPIEDTAESVADDV